MSATPRALDTTRFRLTLNGPQQVVSPLPD
jgi:hypothetical protein